MIRVTLLFVKHHYQRVVHSLVPTQLPQRAPASFIITTLSFCRPHSDLTTSSGDAIPVLPCPCRIKKTSQRMIGSGMSTTEDLSAGSTRHLYATGVSCAWFDMGAS